MSVASKLFGRCALCGRDPVSLTFHHLIPVSMHDKGPFRKLYTKDYMSQHGIDICRPCHSGIHRFYEERELALNFHTLELLLADEKVQKHIKWVAKQRVDFGIDSGDL